MEGLACMHQVNVLAERDFMEANVKTLTTAHTTKIRKWNFHVF